MHVQQSLTNLSNLSTKFLNRHTCWYEQLQLVIIDEISIVNARTFYVINHRLKAIKHIQNEFFNGLDVIMLGDFYQTPLVKDCWVFSCFNDIVNALAPKFWEKNIKCYELTLVMWQTDTQFIKTLNKFHTCTQFWE